MVPKCLAEMFDSPPFTAFATISLCEKKHFFTFSLSTIWNRFFKVLKPNLKKNIILIAKISQRTKTYKMQPVMGYRMAVWLSAKGTSFVALTKLLCMSSRVNEETNQLKERSQ